MGEYKTPLFIANIKNMTEQQQHLSSLLKQREELDKVIAQNRELYWKVQGAIEYLTKIGVTIPDSTEVNSEEQESSAE